MRHDGNPPSDPPGDRELRRENGVEPSEDWSGALVEDATGVEGGSDAARPRLDFDEIVRLYSRRLYLLAYRLTANRAEAEDLSQETLVRGYMAMGRFRGEADFYTYLYRTLLNLWRNQIRSRRRWRLVPIGAGPGPRADDDPPPSELADRSPGPHERLVGREQSEKLHRALLALDPEFRAVLVLRVAEGLEYEEIAEALGINIGTVRSRLARARARVRDRMRKS